MLCQQMLVNLGCGTEEEGGPKEGTILTAYLLPPG